MSKLITVFGATGIQGGSVISAILADPALSKEYKIRGITRDTSKANAQALEKQGVEMVSADLDSKDSILSAIKGSDTVFLVTNFWEKADANVEITQGKNATDAAKEAGVKHIIFSSLLNVTEITNGRLKHVKHFDSKADIEQYIRDSGVPATFVLAGYYMSNYESMLQKGEDGSYGLAYPVGPDSKFPLIDTKSDLGKFVKPALKNPSSWQGKRILAASDYYTVHQIVSGFEEGSGGKKLNFNQVPSDVYKSFLPPFMAQEMLENHFLIESPGYYNGLSLEESLAALDEKPVSWKDYVAKHYA